MVLSLLDCELLNVGGRVYRIIGGSGQGSSRTYDQSTRRTERAIPAQAVNEECDEDDTSLRDRAEGQHI